MFADHNQRIKLSSSQLPGAKKDLYRSYEQWRLDLDEIAWWKGSEFFREEGVLDLLSADETKQLQVHLLKYNESVLKTVNQVTALWNFFDSPEYRMNKASETKKKEIVAEVGKQMGLEYDTRAELVNSVSSVFSTSTHRTDKYTKIGLLGTKKSATSLNYLLKAAANRSFASTAPPFSAAAPFRVAN